jgi:hypothetical protein
MGKKLNVGSTSSGASPLPGVTAENYTEMAQQYATAAGQCHAIVITDTGKEEDWDHLPQLSAWNAYYRIKGMKRVGKHHPDMKVMAQWRVMIKMRGSFVVPCQWPWQFDQSITEMMLGDFRSPVELRRLQKLVERDRQGTRTREARPETVAEAMAFLKDKGVDHLPPEHELRRKATADWARAAIRMGGDRGRYAAGDPNRLGPPKGWAGVR